MTDDAIMVLATNETTNGNYPSDGLELAGGYYTCFVEGTYNGGTVRIEAAVGKSSNFITLSGATFDAANVSPGTITIGRFCKARAVVSGAGGSTDLTVTLVPIPR